MQKVLVTGGGGFLGSAIVHALLEREARVRVLALPNESLDNLENVLTSVEVVRGNVLAAKDCLDACHGTDVVYHCAAIYKDYMADPGPMYQVNLRGTFNVLEAARRSAVKQVVYTASVVALGRPEEGQLANETTPYDAWDLNFHYSRTKHLSLLTALDFSNWGLDVRVVCPAIVLGPGDLTPTPSGRLIVNICSGRQPAITPGGFCYVDVRDAAQVHLLVAEKGKPGQVYVASGHNLDNEAFHRAVVAASGRDLPRAHRVPSLIAQAALSGINFAVTRAGKEPEVTREYMSYALKPGYFSSAKAQRELGASFRPFDETLRDAIAYFRARGMLRN
jgi:dihydroflavonol-4-reductase